MAAIDDLVARVADEKLRQSLQAEIEKLKGQKKFGLVWEEHLTERAELWGVAPRVGMKVARKGGSATYLVQEVEGEELLCTDDAGGQVRLQAADVVAQADFGEAVYPCLVPIDQLVNSREGEAGLWHILIEAENFHALQLLRYLWRGKVDAIYIDPPYNTGARDWKYNNDYVDAADSFRHSKWLSMMKSRLEVARELLNPTDSVLIIAIDDYELGHLLVLLEEVMPGYESFTTVVNHHPQGGAADNISRTHEYAIYVIPRNKKVLYGEKEENFDEEWSLMRGGKDRRNLRYGRPNSFYAVYVDKQSHIVTGVGPHLNATDDYSKLPVPDNCIAIYPIGKDKKERVWRYERSSMQKHIEDGDIICTNQMSLKVIKHRDVKYAPVFSVWTDGRYNAGTYGTSLLTGMFGSDSRFAYPKSLYTVFDALKYATQNKPDALIVDFFAGSGTTAHAVNLLNAADGGRRRCVMVTNNEVSADEARALAKRGIKRGDDEWEALGIARYVTWPRTVCAITGRDITEKPLAGVYAGEYPFATRSATGAGEASNAAGTSAGAGSSDTGGAGEEAAGDFTLAAGSTKSKDKASAGLAMSQGFSANAAFFTLRFLDKEAVALGKQFRALLPLLWLKAGSHGSCPAIADEEELCPWYVFAVNRFAVLLDEAHFGGFQAALAAEDASWGCRMVYLVTDSRQGFRQMSEALGGRQCVQLYKDYLENFKINVPK